MWDSIIIFCNVTSLRTITEPVFHSQATFTGTHLFPSSPCWALAVVKFKIQVKQQSVNGPSFIHAKPSSPEARVKQFSFSASLIMLHISPMQMIDSYTSFCSCHFPLWSRTFFLSFISFISAVSVF